MFTLLTKIFIKNSEDVTNPKVREAYGTLSGAYGIFLNIILFVIKLIAGLLSKSIAITADALNNLSDAGASVLTVIGFKLSGKKPDRNHPFGHGRLEYISGLIVSFLILLMGFELCKTSALSLFKNEKVTSSYISIIILIVSIAVKAYMYVFNHVVAKKINSSSMEATAKDSLSDTISTAVVLISSIIYLLGITTLPIDAFAGFFVSVFIIKNGIESLRDTIGPLLGQPPEKEFVEEIENTVLAHKMVQGIHDLIVHDYGPGRVMISLHAEVDGTKNIYDIHDEIDIIEVELGQKFNCTATIHMDPIDVKSKELKQLKKLIKDEAAAIYTDLSIHDLRIVPGRTHTNLVFDLVKPHECPMSDAEVSELLAERVHQKKPKYYCAIKVEPPFV
ncbi:cation diffusion facilitator family transporter [Treponema sp.]|uniref:cation diffusion facilitator family transporter n=1 Tax=Treponema sp. TaxID=166 RepID=UPI00298DC3FA|nr:cation diffusion facilitator family transporter [Treponema sp.]MCR5613872.1 cation diffusion facilitator family transporter [Treponema sp.]